MGHQMAARPAFTLDCHQPLRLDSDSIKSAQEVTVVSYNLQCGSEQHDGGAVREVHRHWLSLFPALQRMVKIWAADVVCFQNVQKSWFNELAQFMRQLGYGSCGEAPKHAAPGQTNSDVAAVFYKQLKLQLDAATTMDGSVLAALRWKHHSMQATVIANMQQQMHANDGAEDAPCCAALMLCHAMLQQHAKVHLVVVGCTTTDGAHSVCDSAASSASTSPRGRNLSSLSSCESAAMSDCLSPCTSTASSGVVACAADGMLSSPPWLSTLQQSVAPSWGAMQRVHVLPRDGASFCDVDFMLACTATKVVAVMNGDDSNNSAPRMQHSMHAPYGAVLHLL